METVLIIFVFGAWFYGASVYIFEFGILEPFWNQSGVSFEFYALFKLNVTLTVGVSDFKVTFSIEITI